MIQPHCYTQEWIREKSSEIGAVDVGIFEKAIFALSLLEQLCQTELDFVFKGGTALLLHLPKPLRLSIDIDIVCSAEKATFENLLDELLAGSTFTRWDEHVRGDRGLPGRRHYRFFYTSPTQNNSELHILLDVVTERNPLTHLHRKKIEIRFLDVNSPVQVTTPHLESLLGDKLTAFAPFSIGVPLNDRFSQQVIKQLFDIAQLFDHASNITIIREDNQASFTAESGYGEYSGTYHDYLDDVIETSYRICTLDLKGAPTDRLDQDLLIRQGIKQLSNHLIGSKFSLPHAKLAASNVILLAMHLYYAEV